MATALTLKMAAVCMLVLTMGQLMAAVGASAPLVQADAAAPTARRLLSAEDHERRPASDDDPESDKAMEAMMLLRLLQKTKGAAAPAPTVKFSLPICPHSPIHWIRFEKCANTHLNAKLF